MKEFIKNIKKAYWDFEYWLEKKKYVLGVPPFLVFLFMFFVQLDYMTDKKRDVSLLPKEVKERYDYVCQEQLRLWAKQSHFFENFEFEKAKEIDKIRGPLAQECNMIEKSAPRTSWGYNFYVAVGLIDPKKKDSLW